jgi:copper chaperone CopZ
VNTIEYTVPGISCAHCEVAITAEVTALPGVERVSVDLEAKRVVVEGSNLDDAALREAIDEAGYEAA